MQRNMWNEPIEFVSPRRSFYDLTHEHKTTGNMGKIYPIFWEHINPGETWSVAPEITFRFVPLLAPVMHFVRITCNTFFVPNRLMDSGWEDFITQGMNGTDVPRISRFKLQDVYNAQADGLRLRTGQLLDHLGFPTLKRTGAQVFQGEYATSEYSAFSLKAYLLICDNFFRNMNIEASYLPATFMDGGDIPAGDIDNYLYVRQGSWEKDYFTGALPTAQRGNEASVVAPVTAIQGPTIGGIVRTAFDASVAPAAQVLGTDNVNPSTFSYGPSAGVTNTHAYYDPNGTLSSTFLISAIRVAEALQELFERRNISGPRYIDWIKGIFGVVSSDARLQLPEYCGGGSQQLVFSEVLQTAPTQEGTTPIATMAGRGLSHGKSPFMGGYFEEHGILMTTMRVLPNNGYANILRRQWTQLSMADFFMPQLAHLGEQIVYRAETHRDWTEVGGEAAGAQTFGYNPQYSYYKWIPSIATGDMKESLSYWNMNRLLTGEAQLNAAFTQCNPDARQFADITVDDDHFIAHIMNHVFAKRPIPVHATPSIQPRR